MNPSDLDIFGDSDDLAAEWDVVLSDMIHKVKFQHGTVTGKRVIIVDGEEVLRKNWMFSLVGKEDFKLSGKKAEIIIDSHGWDFEYTLRVEGKNLKKFLQNRMKNTRTWLPTVEGEPHRVVLEVDKMDVWVDGVQTEALGEFGECGTETHFLIGSSPVFIRTVSSGNRKKGLLHSLVIDDKEMDPIDELGNIIKEVDKQREK